MKKYAMLTVKGAIGLLPTSFRNRLKKNTALTAFYSRSLHKSGLFYGNLSKKEKVNLISVKFLVSFATFDGGRGFKSINLSTKPLLALSLQATLVTANGSINFISYAKLPAVGGEDWSLGLKKGKDNRSDAEFFGLARSADFELTADSDKYLAEVRAMISALQKDIAKQIKAKL